MDVGRDCRHKTENWRKKKEPSAFLRRNEDCVKPNDVLREKKLNDVTCKTCLPKTSKPQNYLHSFSLMHGHIQEMNLSKEWHRNHHNHNPNHISFNHTCIGDRTIRKLWQKCNEREQYITGSSKTHYVILYGTTRRPGQETNDQKDVATQTATASSMRFSAVQMLKDASD